MNGFNAVPLTVDEPYQCEYAPVIFNDDILNTTPALIMTFAPSFIFHTG